jgi:hypothetical protein
MEVLAMPDAKYFARKAKQCRDLLKLAQVPEVIEQLRLWAAEFEAAALDSARREPHKRRGTSIQRDRTRRLRA